MRVPIMKRRDAETEADAFSPGEWPHARRAASPFRQLAPG